MVACTLHSRHYCAREERGTLQETSTLLGSWIIPETYNRVVLVPTSSTSCSSLVAVSGPEALELDLSCLTGVAV